jgi:hypothetical protein
VPTKPQPAWPLPVMALVQVHFGTALVSPLRESGAPWSVGYAVLSGIASLGGLVVLAFAVRNCIRLWQVQPWEASWTLVAATVLVTLFSALVATGPVSIGLWRWESLIPGTLAVYLIVVLARETSRLLARSPGPNPSVES